MNTVPFRPNKKELCSPNSTDPSKWLNQLILLFNKKINFETMDEILLESEIPDDLDNANMDRFF
jgi:hypothetical protein